MSCRTLTKNFESVMLHNVGFATDASQNGFSTYKLSIHKKNNLILKKCKIFSLSSFSVYH